MLYSLSHIFKLTKLEKGAVTQLSQFLEVEKDWLYDLKKLKGQTNAVQKLADQFDVVGEKHHRDFHHKGIFSKLKPLFQLEPNDEEFGFKYLNLISDAEKQFFENLFNTNDTAIGLVLLKEMNIEPSVFEFFPYTSRAFLLFGLAHCEYSLTSVAKRQFGGLTTLESQSEAVGKLCHDAEIDTLRLVYYFLLDIGWGENIDDWFFNDTESTLVANLLNHSYKLKEVENQRQASKWLASIETYPFGVDYDSVYRSISNWKSSSTKMKASDRKLWGDTFDFKEFHLLYPIAVILDKIIEINKKSYSWGLDLKKSWELAENQKDAIWKDGEEIRSNSPK